MSTNLLDTFIIAFEGDSSDVQQSAEQGRAAAAEMADEIDRAGTAAEQSSQDLQNFFSALAGTGAAALATFSAAVAGLVSAQESLSETKGFADDIGAKATDVALIEQMTVRAGGSVDKTREALKKLSKDGGDATKRLGELAKTLEGLDGDGQEKLLDKLGLDFGDEFTSELAKGYGHYTQMMAGAKANALFTERDYENAKEVSHLWSQIQAGFTGVPMALSLLSTKASGMLKEVLTLWRDFQQSPMSEGMIKTIEVAAIGLENMWKMIKLVGVGLSWVYDKLRDFLPVIAGIGGALVVALMPLQYLGFGLIIAGIAALLLVLDDLRAYFQGEESIFGEFLADHPKVAEFIRQLGGLFSQMGDAASAAWGVLKEKAGELWDQLQQFIPTTDDISDGFAKVSQFLEENKDTLISVAKAAATLLAMWLAYKAKALLDETTDGGTMKYLLKMIGVIGVLTAAWKGLSAAAAKAWGVVQETASAVGDKLGLSSGGKSIPGADAAVAQITAANASPINGMTSAAISNASANNSRNTEVNIDQVMVQTQATDADGISKGISDSLSAQLRQAADHHDDGISH